MIDEKFYDHFRSVEETFRKYLEVYLKLKTKNEKIKIEDNNQELKKLLLNKKEIENKYLKQKVKNEDFEKDGFRIDFDLILDIFKEFYDFDSNSSFEKNFLWLIFNELKMFRNLFFHEKTVNIEDELIQRFFENVHFFFKFIKFPNHKNHYNNDNYLLKELPLSIHLCMKINSNKFKLDYPSEIDKISNEKEKENYSLSEYNTLFLEEALKQNKQIKLFDYEIEFKEINSNDLQFDSEINQSQNNRDSISKSITNNKISNNNSKEDQLMSSIKSSYDYDHNHESRNSKGISNLSKSESEN